MPTADAVRAEVERYLFYRGNRKKVQLAFFGGNFLGLERKNIHALLTGAQKLVQEGKIHGVRFSTRPDTITEKMLDMVSGFSVSTVELGVQSMDDSVLFQARRGHRAEDTIRASSLLRQYKLETGMQIMVGLPGDSHATAMKTAGKVAHLKPDFVRIYPLMVLEGSLIARWYREGKYHPMSLDNCISTVKSIYRIFDENKIPVIRMGLQASELMEDESSMLAGPWHPAFGHLVLSELMFDKAVEKLESLGLKKPHNAVTLMVHPISQSRLRGDKNNNLKRLQSLYPGVMFKIMTDGGLKRDDIFISGLY